MKQEYKFLIDLCNSYVAPLDHDGDFDDRWWHTATGYGLVTPKSTFVETMINLLTIKDKKFPKREFLKQVKCHYRSNSLIDREYSRQSNEEHYKQLQKESESNYWRVD
jgi:hypothetical protein